MTNSDEEILSTDPSARYRSRNTDKKSGASSGGFITVVFLFAALAATDFAMSQGGEDTKEQISLWESEIRKLWAIANERNKGWIKDNQADLKEYGDTIDSLVAKNRDLTAATSRHEESLGQQQELIDQITSLKLQIQQMSRSQRDLVDKVNAANQKLTNIETTIKVDVDDNSEAVRSFDAYRIATNKRVNQLEEKLGVLTGTSTP